MDELFQDKIDKYLLHGDQMSDEEKNQFLKEIELDKEKKELFEFTRNVKEAITSREEKLKAIAAFQEQHLDELMKPSIVSYGRPVSAVPDLTERKATSANKKIWWWISGIAAIVIAGFFIIRPFFVRHEMLSPLPMEQIRGDEDVFEKSIPFTTDTMACDTIPNDTNSIEPNDE